MQKPGSAYTDEAVRTRTLEREAFKKTPVGILLLETIENFSKEQLRELIITMNLDEFGRRGKIDAVLEEFPVAQSLVRGVLEDEAMAYAH